MGQNQKAATDRDVVDVLRAAPNSTAEGVARGARRRPLHRP